MSASSPHSGDWLYAMPITSCGLRLDDEAVRVAVGLRLGSSLCVPHQCQCGSLVIAHGLHSFVCKKAPSRTSRHHALNDMVARAFASAAIPVAKEPQGLSRADGKRPDGLTMVPWRERKPLTWTLLLSAPWPSRTLVTRLRIRKSSQIRRFREDAHLPAGCRRKLRHDERVSVRLLSRAWAENLGDIWRRS